MLSGMHVARKEGQSLGMSHQLLQGEEGGQLAEVCALQRCHRARCEQLRQLSSAQRIQHVLTQAGLAMRARCCKELREECQ